MMSEQEIKKYVTQIGNSLLTNNDVDFERFDKPITIKEASEIIAQAFYNEAKENQAIAIIGVVLSINRNINRFVNPRKQHFLKETQNKVKTIDDLDTIFQKVTEDEFFKLWNYNDTNRYITLRNLIAKITQLSKKYPNAKNDYELLNSWAKNFDETNWEKDPLRIPNFGIAALQHLRMVFGAEVIKPDRHVLKILGKLYPNTEVTEKKAIELMEKVSKITDISPFILDKIFFKYGACGYLN